jgi:hypothetical protein
MTAQIIALPKRDRNPHRHHPEVQAFIASVHARPSRATLRKGQYIERATIPQDLADEWGVSVTVHPQGGAV